MLSNTCVEDQNFYVKFNYFTHYCFILGTTLLQNLLVCARVYSCHRLKALTVVHIFQIPQMNAAIAHMLTYKPGIDDCPPPCAETEVLANACASIEVLGMV